MNQTNKKTLEWLKGLGKLPDNFDSSSISPFLNHENTKIRILAVANIGKIKNIKYLNKLSQMVENDSSSVVKSEAAAAIGKMRNESTIPILINFLKNDDPSVVIQSLRALSYFKDNKNASDAFLEMQKHENESIRNFALNIKITKTKKENQNNHSKSHSFLKNTVVLGDVIETLKLIPDESFHLTFTSPPYYNAKDYSTYISYNEYLDFLKNVFENVHRCTKEGRFFVLNTSPVIVPRISRAHSSKRHPIPFDVHPILTDIGWEFVDDIIWQKPEPTVKNRNGGFFQHRNPLAYKPNNVTEYLMVYRKKTDRLIDWNLKQYDQKISKSSKVSDGYETSNLWKIDPTFDKGHTAVFPKPLCERVISYYSMKNDLVFDPFGGSGTLGLSANELARNFFMAENLPEHIERMKQKLSSVEDCKFLNIDDLAKMIEKQIP